MQIEITPEFLKLQGFNETFAARFWKRVDKTATCWNWMGSRNHKGYGQINKGKHKLEICSRASWMLHYGAIKKGLLVCHHCDNPSCVRPDHLFVGTPKQNTDDMIKKGRHDFSHRRKLSEEDVCKIRSLHVEMGPRTCAKIARMFNVNRHTISDIVAHRKRR
jgi:hypothetical protein